LRRRSRQKGGLLKTLRSLVTRSSSKVAPNTAAVPEAQPKGTHDLILSNITEFNDNYKDNEKLHQYIKGQLDIIKTNLESKDTFGNRSDFYNFIQINKPVFNPIVPHQKSKELNLLKIISFYKFSQSKTLTINEYSSCIFKSHLACERLYDFVYDYFKTDNKQSDIDILNDILERLGFIEKIVDIMKNYNKEIYNYIAVLLLRLIDYIKPTSVRILDRKKELEKSIDQYDKFFNFLKGIRVSIEESIEETLIKKIKDSIQNSTIEQLQKDILINSFQKYIEDTKKTSNVYLSLSIEKIQNDIKNITEPDIPLLESIERCKKDVKDSLLNKDELLKSIEEYIKANAQAETSTFDIEENCKQKILQLVDDSKKDTINQLFVDFGTVEIKNLSKSNIEDSRNKIELQQIKGSILYQNIPLSIQDIFLLKSINDFNQFKEFVKIDKIKNTCFKDNKQVNLNDTSQVIKLRDIYFNKYDESNQHLCNTAGGYRRRTKRIKKRLTRRRL